MNSIEKILISPKLIEYLQSRQLEKQYKKAKNYILSWVGKNVNLKLREPKAEKIWYFRINKQYRAVWRLQWSVLRIYAIDNHQN